VDSQFLPTWCGVAAVFVKRRGLLINSDLQVVVIASEADFRGMAVEPFHAFYANTPAQFDLDGVDGAKNIHNAVIGIVRHGCSWQDAAE
jgi:hypothetical protein